MCKHAFLVCSLAYLTCMYPRLYECSARSCLEKRVVAADPSALVLGFVFRPFFVGKSDSK